MIITLEDRRTRIDTDELSLPELEALRDAKRQAADNIEYDIDMATAKYHTTGERSDPVWLAKARRALKHNRQDYQRLVQELSQRRKALGAKKEHDFAQAFMSIARRHLPEEEFYKILTLAADACDMPIRRNVVRGEKGHENESTD